MNGNSSLSQVPFQCNLLFPNLPVLGSEGGLQVFALPGFLQQGLQAAKARHFIQKQHSSQALFGRGNVGKKMKKEKKCRESKEDSISGPYHQQSKPVIFKSICNQMSVTSRVVEERTVPDQLLVHCKDFFFLIIASSTLYSTLICLSRHGFFNMCEKDR